MRNSGEWDEQGNSSVHITAYDGMMGLRIDAGNLPLREKAFYAMRTLHTGGFTGRLCDFLLTVAGIGMIYLGLIGLITFISARLPHFSMNNLKMSDFLRKTMNSLKRVNYLLAGCLPLPVFASSPASASTCLKVTLTGTQGGPPIFQGQAGSGTLVQYGDEENACSDVNLQFDTGRGTNQQLSKLGVPVSKINAVFFTHLHSDHTEGLSDMAQLRWHFNSSGPKLDLVCTDDAESSAGHTMSCSNYARHIGDPLMHSGEIAQRLSESSKRLPGGPADILLVKTFEAQKEPAVVWESGDVTVSAIASRHIAGHASYRVDTPAGSVVVGGDAGNDSPAPPRSSSTSEQVELIAKDVDIIVHSTIHPVMGPDKDSGFPAPIYFRQSTAADLGAMAERTNAKHLMLTHLIPPLGAATQGPYKIPGGALTELEYTEAVTGAGFTGNTIVGTDLVSITLHGQ